MINEKYFNRLLGSLIVVALALPLTPSMVAAQDNGPGYTQVRTWSQRIRLQPCCHGWQQQHLVRHNASIKLVGNGWTRPSGRHE